MYLAVKELLRSQNYV